MTMNEHTLVMGMFARQAQQIKALFEILKSRGIMQGDDEAAFKDLVHKDASGPLAIETYMEYKRICEQLEIPFG